MEEEPGEFDGDALSPRDAVAAGEDFIDLFCPLLCLRCGEDEEGNQVSVQAVAVGEVQGKLLIAVPAAAWHRKVAKRSVPRGFMTKVFAAETAVCTLQDRGSEVEGQVVRIWLGYCEPSAESALEISDEEPVVGFGRLPSGEPLLPFVEALAEIWQAQLAAGSTSAQTANEAPAVPQDWAERFATMERSLAQLSASLRGGSHASPLGEPEAPAPQPVAATKAPRKVAPKVQASPATQVFPGLDQGVVAAAIAAGVEPQALSEMSRLVSSGPLTRLRSEPARPQRTSAALDESEEEPQRLEPDAPALDQSTPQKPHGLEVPAADALAQALVRCLDSAAGRSLNAKGSPLERALDASAGGSLEGSLNTGRRNAAARRALRESLTTSPQELSGLIEQLMSEDLAASTPGVGSPAVTSARGWLEHRSRVQAYPTVVHLSWAIAGALDCLRAGQPEQARARLNIALLQADQMSVDRGSWLLAQELSLELPPPMGAFKRHDTPASSTDPVYSRLLDPRWAEIALSRLRDEADFLDKRQKLSTRHTPTINKDTSEPSGEGSACADEWSPGLWRKRLLNLTVAMLNFLHLGRPSLCPPAVRVGTPVNRRQWAAVNGLQHLVFGSFFPLRFEPADYGRIGHKVEGQDRTLTALGRAAASLCRGFAGYMPKADAPTSPHQGPVPVEAVGSLPGRPDVAALPIVADRVKLPAKPCFRPQPYMDSTTKEFYDHPLRFARRPEPGVDQPPFVKILADRTQTLLLLRSLAQSGRLQRLDTVPAERLGWGAGAFCVAKDELRDRLVLDARPANQLESFPGRWVRALASAACLAGVLLKDQEALLMSGTDLVDCFYQFQVTDQRATRNLLACELTSREAELVFDAPAGSFEAGDGPILVGLSSLAMGDSSACEFAQCSHLGTLVQGRAVFPGELLVHASAPPRGLLSIGLVIDDLIILQRCLACDLERYRASPGLSEGSQRLRRATDAYDRANLRFSPKKTFEDQSRASFWGVDCCGTAGLVRANPSRYWALVLITTRVMQLGLATRSLLESLLGSWVSVFILRRRLLCLADLCFQAVRHGEPQTVLRLSPELLAELATFVLLGHTAVLDLRAPVRDHIIATDASSSWQAAVEADIEVGVAEEFFRHALQRGAWTRLLTPPSAWLREHDLLSPESELPGDMQFVTHPVAEAAARVPAYRCLWRQEYRTRMHINIAELGAYLREESRLAGRCKSVRQLFGLDSQVCLGALVKGRSASPALNRMLQASLGPLLSSRIFPAYFFFPSALNPADDPTRGQPVRRPSLQPPDWWHALVEGSAESFDVFLKLVESDDGDCGVFQQEDLLDLGGVALPVPLPRLDTLSRCIPPQDQQAISMALMVPQVQGLQVQVLLICVLDHLQTRVYMLVRAPAFLAQAAASPSQVLQAQGLQVQLRLVCVLVRFQPSRLSMQVRALGFSVQVISISTQVVQVQGLLARRLLSRVSSLVQATGLQVQSFTLVSRSRNTRSPGPWLVFLAPPSRCRGAKLLTGGFLVCCAWVQRAARRSALCCVTARPGYFAWTVRVVLVKTGASSSFSKVLADNLLNQWILRVIRLASSLGLFYCAENPDTSYFWQMPGWEDEASAGSRRVFRADLCQFGCLWRKRTRVATNTSLAGARLLCDRAVQHLRLVGRSSVHRLPWTSVADTTPAGFADALALAVSTSCGWSAAGSLDPSACAKLGCCCRVGEAKNPGPRRASRTLLAARRSGDLESRPLQSDTSLRLGTWAWDAFLVWVSRSLSVDPLSVFASCPVLAAMALRAYGNHLYAAGGSKHTFRYTLVGAQRAILTLKGSLGPAWELLTRWEAVEPTVHRTPLPEPLLRAMVTVGWLRGLRRWAGCALLAFYGMARVGEVLRCERRHLLLRDDLFHSAEALFLRLDTSKTATRGRPKVQHIRIDDSSAMELITIAFKDLQPAEPLFPLSPSAFRSRWDSCLRVLGLAGAVNVTPGSLRGGGAVSAYHRGVPIQDIQWKLRLKHMATLEHYLQEVAALGALNQASDDAKRLIRFALQLYPCLCYSA
ncbi:unnamed protein product [Symbiodinium microadriaticum]|nr:unnamed protein product [Symbiodinium microadriaticum]